MSATDNAIVQKTITIDSFFNQAFFIKDKKKVNAHQRVLLLKQAMQGIKKDIGLGADFKKNFLYFLKNSSFVFKFFDEVFAEKRSLDEIELHDIEGEFIDYIDTLKEVHIAYKILLGKYHLYDQSTISEYHINENFLSSFSGIEFVLEGYLSKRELDICIQCSQVTPLFIRLYATKYNEKMLSCFNYDFIKNTEYLYDLARNEVVWQAPIMQSKDIFCESVKERIGQCSFVQKKIHEYIHEDHFEPENIAVVLPDEKFASELKEMDVFHNLNFAMGIPFVNFIYFKKLQSLYEYLLDSTKENEKRVQLFALETLATNTKKSIDENISNVFEFFSSFASSHIGELSNGEEYLQVSGVVRENVFFMSKLRDELCDFSFVELLSYYLHLIQKASLPHKSGGKVKVIGVLESRNTVFDGVIVVDFNDDIVPLVSQKDIFLNSKIKKHSGIPTKQDRENLQKYYYTRIFQNAKKVSICYVQNEQKSPSKFLGLFNIALPNENTTLNHLLFAKPKIIKHKREQDFLYTNENLQLSYNKFKDFIECKQRYYNKYILGLKIENDASFELKNYEVGSIIHGLLKDVKTPTDLAYFKDKITQKAMSYKQTHSKLTFDLLKFATSADDFIASMKQRLENGLEILGCESTFEMMVDGVLFGGRIDKIEKYQNDILIVDYKIKSQANTAYKVSPIEKMQLYIYYLYARSQYPNSNILLFHHYLPSNQWAQIEVDNELVNEFNTHLQEYKQEFSVEKTDKRQACMYCDYSTLCER